MQLIDPSHPFYRPLWIRLLVVGSCTAWTAVEAYARQPFWAVITAAAAVYSAYMLLFTYKPAPEAPAAPPSSDSNGPEQP